ncbi:serine/threonine dehydratase [Tistrella bauzanensis]|uniref:Serine/threonine dehydratase n=1 Tax=Tistrella bauzanensis TaxID=657419 RepID=A0ABQ1ITG0_9PROT|nr:pyridoxal-phosphate dependent enzyme [Tistrella bauzanensis]GGB51576.1 serine/threonine dehydratase [Tistrella bauzanensis]
MPFDPDRPTPPTADPVTAYAPGPKPAARPLSAAARAGAGMPLTRRADGWATVADDATSLPPVDAGRAGTVALPPRARPTVQQIQASNWPTLAVLRRTWIRQRSSMIETPLLRSARVDDELGGRLLVKAEVLQHTGSFKYRGAYNRLELMSPELRARGVVGYSSGNHAQGLAAAAREFGAPAVIVMPADAPRTKIEGVAAYGGEIVFYDRAREDRVAITRRIGAERGMTVVSAYDDRDVISGQGSIAVEMLDQAESIGQRPDVVVVPCGGGGLAAGTGLCLQAMPDRPALVIVEPAGHDDTARSIAEGRRLPNPPGIRTICDALATPIPGALTYAINAQVVDAAVAVTDADIAHAMLYAFARFKLVVEPGGAAALAAVLSGRVPVRGRSVMVVLTGGNVDPETFAAALTVAQAALDEPV